MRPIWDLRNAIIPDGVRRIGDGAFSDCGFLRSVFLPDSVTAIDATAFAACENATFTVGAGSYAERFCREQGLAYVCSGEAESAEE